jgi:hypothetical protein
MKKRIWDWWLEDLHPAHLSRPRSTMQSWAREIFWERVKLLGNRSRAAYISVSLTVKFGNRTSSCVTNPILKNPPSMHPYTRPKVNEIGTCSFSYLGSRKNQKKLHKFTCKEASSAWEISLIQHTDWILHLFVHHHFLCSQIFADFWQLCLIYLKVCESKFIHVSKIFTSNYEKEVWIHIQWISACRIWFFTCDNKMALINTWRMGRKKYRKNKVSTACKVSMQKW